MYQRGEIIEHVTLWHVTLCTLLPVIIFSCYCGGLAFGFLGVPSSLPGAVELSFVMITPKTDDAADDECADDGETTNAPSNEQQHVAVNRRRAVGACEDRGHY